MSCTLPYNSSAQVILTFSVVGSYSKLNESIAFSGVIFSIVLGRLASIVNSSFLTPPPVYCLTSIRLSLTVIMQPVLLVNLS